MYLSYLQSFSEDLAARHGPEATFIAILTVHNLIVFGSCNLFFALCDQFGWFKEQKIRKPDQVPSPKLVRKAFIHVMFHNLIGYPAGLWIFYELAKYLRPEQDMFSAPVPALQLFVQILICIAVEDTMFYWLHRGLHHRSIYKYIHKQHHEFRNSIGIASEYAHPVEVILANGLPFFMGPLLTQMNITSIALWNLVRIWETIDAHSGYQMKWSPWNFLLSIQGGAARHDFHHSKNVGSYGSFTKFWDWVMGTDQHFIEFQKKTRSKQE